MPAPRITEAVLRDAQDKRFSYRVVAQMTGCKEQSVRNVCAELGIKLISDGGHGRGNATTPMQDAADLLPIDDSDVDRVGCMNLWRSVLLEQARLALTVGAFAGCHGYSNPAERRIARAWFGTREFHTVCALAGFDGDAVLDGYNRQLVEAQRQEAAFAEACKAGRAFRPWGPGYMDKRIA